MELKKVLNQSILTFWLLQKIAVGVGIVLNLLLNGATGAGADEGLSLNQARCY